MPVLNSVRIEIALWTRGQSPSLRLSIFCYALKQVNVKVSQSQTRKSPWSLLTSDLIANRIDETNSNKSNTFLSNNILSEMRNNKWKYNFYLQSSQLPCINVNVLVYDRKSTCSTYHYIVHILNNIKFVKNFVRKIFLL